MVMFHSFTAWCFADQATWVMPGHARVMHSRRWLSTGCQGLQNVAGAGLERKRFETIPKASKERSVTEGGGFAQGDCAESSQEQGACREHVFGTLRLYSLPQTLKRDRATTAWAALTKVSLLILFGAQSPCRAYLLCMLYCSVPPSTAVNSF